MGGAGQGRGRIEQAEEDRPDCKVGRYVLCCMYVHSSGGSSLVHPRTRLMLACDFIYDCIVPGPVCGVVSCPIASAASAACGWFASLVWFVCVYLGEPKRFRGGWGEDPNQQGGSRIDWPALGTPALFGVGLPLSPVLMFIFVFLALLSIFILFSHPRSSLELVLRIRCGFTSTWLVVIRRDLLVSSALETRQTAQEPLDQAEPVPSLLFFRWLPANHCTVDGTDK